MKKLFLLFVLVAIFAAFPAALAECNHDFYMANIQKPTCESDGYYILKCSKCGYATKESNGEAYGHNWKLVSEKKASCTDAGYKKYECENCHDTKQTNIAKLSHSWKDSHVLEDATCTKEGSMRTVCTKCNLSGIRTIEKKGHKYSAWKVTVEATDHSKGTRTRTCSICKNKQSEEFYPEGTLYKDIKNKTEEVMDLQQKLTDLGFLNDVVDGKFGKKTQAAVIIFQKAYDLSADGIAWPETLYTLDAGWNEAFGAELTEPANAYPPVCNKEMLGDGAEFWDMCEIHSEIFMHAADYVNEDSSEIEFVLAYTDAWQAELDRLYQLWMEMSEDEEQPAVINHKAMFNGYLNSQHMIWTLQYGEESIEAAEKVNGMLMEQCLLLCGIVNPVWE